LTKGYRLPARYVIHAVGPVWDGGAHGEPELLASCYRRALEIAMEHGLSSIAFPSISTGIYGYPIDLATPVAITAVRDALQEVAQIQEVIFCCFSQQHLAVYESFLTRAPHKHV
jgi:O-acetyl-ADP-ribose deacetylase (regulator of RNase III)